MKRLHLLRHAHTLVGDPLAPDHVRALSATGREECAAVAAWWRGTPPPVEKIVCSTAVRAVETYEALKEGIPDLPEASFQPKLYLASPDEILKVLKNASDGAQNILVIGHNPGLHELAISLCDEACEALSIGMPTAGFLTFESDAELWKALPEATNRLARFERV